MIDIKECDVVKLKDGRTGTVLGIWSDGKAYEVEIDPPELETIEKEGIQEVIYKA
ncbi:hypothetical protein [Clostridium neonatale]|uniref:hypothetical protein n=1 Tax=Clostridium neonatale TaxID=137838 RepID=UPI001E071E72|nr:hypothetical protein [Clostridium neonatale]CAG9719533.1 conserved hypothetical protein [Clostridium neonatale]